MAYSVRICTTTSAANGDVSGFILSHLAQVAPC